MRGFTNKDNTCYLATALQCLLHAPQLVNYLLAEVGASVDMNTRKRNAAALTKEIISAAQHFWKDPGDEPLPLDDLATALQRHAKTFAKGSFQDAHECILALIDALHQGLSKTSRVSRSLAREALQDQTAHLAAWDEACSKDYSFLTEIFQGQSKNSKGAYEHFWSVSLNVASGDSLTQLLESHFDATTVTYAPLILLVHFNRFDATGNKVKKFIDYGTELDFADASYALFAVCMHAESHYTAICEHRGHWSFYDDAACIRTTDPNGIIQRDAYVLCYKKVLES